MPPPRPRTSTGAVPVIARIIDRSCGARSHSASFSVWNLPSPSRCEWMYLTSPSSPLSISAFSFTKAGWKRSTWPVMKTRPLSLAPPPPRARHRRRSARSAFRPARPCRSRPRLIAHSAWNCGGSAMTMASMSSRDDNCSRRDRQAILLAGKAFGAGAVGVRDRVQRAERLQGADVVAAPISATEDCDARLHSSLDSDNRGRDIAARRRELNPAGRKGSVPPITLIRRRGNIA